ncbi:MAG: hypothetical protein F6K53_36615 [Moorea sp. SIO4A1]|uniref:hypothetical protein n=2 Tax=unclassified Moorena TaxID=2683338 RepID=UPI00144E26F8|nr:hypothetical protein [Moorena sp. SIO4A1]NEQ62609.1 hypothetical protein [Moorena sp. SIO4A1]
MDSLNIAKAAVSILTPYLAQVGGSVAQEVGGSVWKKTKEVHSAIVKQFSGEGTAQQALERLEEEPLNEVKKADFIRFLKEKLEADRKFAEQLKELIEDVPQVGNNEFNTNIQGGSVGKQVNIGSAGDVSF